MALPLPRPGLFTALCLTACLHATRLAAADFYVAPDGSAEAPGTLAAPVTLERALALVAPGDTIYLRGGDYAFATQVTIAKENSGTAEARKQLVAYAPPGGAAERPRLDFSGQAYAKNNNVRGLQLNGDWWRLSGLEVSGSADNGIYVGGSHNIVERCITHHNRDTGLQIGRAAATDAEPATWPSHNLILNCESHDNYDAPPGAGENADGFACKLTTGPGNVFRGCVAHHNVDDGWDLYTKIKTGAIGAVVLDQCIAYANGTLSDGTQSAKGDRNGFKLGGSKIPVPHVVTRCIAFGNGKNGFTWNSNPGAIRLFNNLAWDNAQGNYKFDSAEAVFLNNLSFFTAAGAGKSDRYGGASGAPTGPSNIFFSTSGKTRVRNDRGLTVSAASFLSLAPPAGGFARAADGSLDLGDFARLVPDSPLIDAGMVPTAYASELPYDPVTAYQGAPDLGARETAKPGNASR